eukprot:3202665-Rhodomonas_salina.1
MSSDSIASDTANLAGCTAWPPPFSLAPSPGLSSPPLSTIADPASSMAAALPCRSLTACTYNLLSSRWAPSAIPGYPGKSYPDTGIRQDAKRMNYNRI